MAPAKREHSVFHTLDLRSGLALAIALERAPMGVLMLQDQFGGQLYPALSHGMSAAQCSGFGAHRPGIGPIGLAFSERRTVGVHATGDVDDDLRGLMQVLRCPRLSVVPLFVDPSNVLGLLLLLHRQRRPAPGGPLLLMYSSVLATALENLDRRSVGDIARERPDAGSSPAWSPQPMRPR